MKRLMIFCLMLFPGICYAEPLGNNITYSGVNKFVTTATQENGNYNSVNNNENAILVSNGTISLNNPTINKTGNSNGDNADFYGINAAVLTYKNSVLNISGGNVTTNGTYANGLFSYGTSKINATNTVIKTTNNNSGGIMVAGGGSIIANNLTIDTAGNSSAAIRSDRGGGNITVNKGSYKTDGIGSPAIYSTAKIIVNDATLTSNKSEGVIVEGNNSVILNNVNLTDNNTNLNGQSDTYKNIFLYHSMSRDAKAGVGTFTATNSTIKTLKGDTIFVTNTRAIINLTNNKIINNSGDFLRIQSSKWGNSLANGGNVTLNLSKQKVEGNIIVDKISTLTLNMVGSSLKTSINNKNEAQSINLNLSKDSKLVLTSDSYVTTLKNEDATNSNIYLNGHKLYVNGQSISANDKEEETETPQVISSKKTTKNKKSSKELYYIIAGSLGILIIITMLYIIFKINTRNKMN